MTVGEFKKFLADNNVSDDIELCIEEGIDVIDYVGSAVYNQVEIVLYPKSFEEHFHEASRIA